MSRRQIYLAVTQLAVITLAMLSSSAPAIAQKTLGHWVFAEEFMKAGRLQARQGSLNPRVQGPTHMLGAPFPTALVFSSREDRVTLASSLRKAKLPKGPFTVSTWVAVDKPLAWGGIVSVMQDNGSFEKGWLLGFRGSRFCFGLATLGTDDGDGKMTYLSGNRNFEVGTWHQVTATYDQKIMRLYVDGKEQASSTRQSGPVLYPRRATFEIGAYLDDDEHYPLEGLIHEVRLEEGVASASEIAKRFAASKQTFAPQTQASQAALSAWLFDRAHVKPKQILAVHGDAKLTIDKPPLLAEGHQPAAIVLDGETSFILDAEAGASTRALTVELSVWIADSSGRGTLISAHDTFGANRLGWRVDYQDGHFRFGITAGSENSDPTFIRADSPIEAFRWHHVVATFDGTQSRLIVDGLTEAASRRELGSIRLPENLEIRIGAHRTTSQQGTSELRFGVALLHSLALYDSILAADTIAQNSQALALSVPAALTFAVEPRLRYTGPNRARVLWQNNPSGRSAVEYVDRDGRPKRVESNRKGTIHTCEIEDLPAQGDFTFRIIHTTEDGTQSASPTQVIDTTFNDSLPTKVAHPSPFPADELTAKYRAAANKILTRTGITRGYCLVLDADEGRLAYELALASDLQIIAITNDRESVAAIRKALSRTGLYGPRITVIQADARALPFGDFFANLIVSDRSIRTGETHVVPAKATAELQRVLRPSGGVMALDLAAPTTRPALDGAGEWTHQYGDDGNTASSGDMRVAGELELQWFGKPGPRPMLDRGCRAPAPQYSGGRLFIQGDRKLFSLDAYNGTILWTLEIPALRRVNMPRDCSNMTATPNHIYTAIGNKCWMIDAQTGELLNALALPPNQADDLEWGYLGVSGQKLLGTATPGKAIYKSANGEWYDKQDSDAAPVLGHTLFALNLADQSPAWQYHGGLIVHPTITVHNDTIYFVEERQPSKASRESSRLRDMDGKHQYLVALDLNSGNQVWERQFDFSRCKQVFYLSAAKNTLAVLGTSGRYHLYGFDASTGTPLWSHSHEWKRDHHGGGMQHPVIVGNSIYAEMKALDLRTGKLTREDLPQRRGCGTMSASGRSIFYRHYHHGMWDLETDRRTQMPGIRSGCWLGMIPAGGLLLAPETSSGCSCAIPIQSSVAYRPKTQ